MTTQNWITQLSLADLPPKYVSNHRPRPQLGTCLLVSRKVLVIKVVAGKWQKWCRNYQLPGAGWVGCLWSLSFSLLAKRKSPFVRTSFRCSRRSPKPIQPGNFLETRIHFSHSFGFETSTVVKFSRQDPKTATSVDSSGVLNNLSTWHGKHNRVSLFLATMGMINREGHLDLDPKLRLRFLNLPDSSQHFGIGWDGSSALSRPRLGNSQLEHALWVLNSNNLYLQLLCQLFLINLWSFGVLGS